MSENRSHIDVLDGWRGISILLVMAAHLLPLGPKAWRLNEAAGPMGMALFFTLSGFLIVRLFLTGIGVESFLIRRLFRIVPLAWLTMLIAFPLAGASSSDYVANFFFLANLPPQHLVDAASHFWSLCVEMQFYLVIAIAIALCGRRLLYVLPLACLAITVHRMSAGALVDIVTWRRVDEILAGGLLALVYQGRLWPRLAVALSHTSFILLLGLFLVSCHPDSGFMNYLRPYLAAAMVGRTLLNPPPLARAVLRTRTLKYVAAISFALYVFHGLLIDTWLGSGERWEKYLKRPLLVLTTFVLAHLSTFHFEQRWIELGRRLSNHRSRMVTS